MGWYETQQFQDMPDLSEMNPVKQPHCCRCGSFLPYRPTGTKKQCVSASIHYGYDEEGYVSSMLTTNEKYEENPFWECNRCHYWMWIEDLSF